MILLMKIIKKSNLFRRVFSYKIPNSVHELDDIFNKWSNPPKEYGYIEFIKEKDGVFYFEIWGSGRGGIVHIKLFIVENDILIVELYFRPASFLMPLFFIGLSIPVFAIGLVFGGLLLLFLAIMPILNLFAESKRIDLLIRNIIKYRL